MEYMYICKLLRARGNLIVAIMLKKAHSHSFYHPVVALLFWIKAVMCTDTCLYNLDEDSGHFCSRKTYVRMRQA